MKLRFDYKKILRPKGKSHLIPVIPIGIENNGNTINYEALIDSGADMNLFPWDIADLFGFEEKDAHEVKEIYGVSGKPLQAYFYDVIIVVGGVSKNIARCGFAKNLPKTGFGFLGQEGFFSHYRIEFDHSKESICLWDRPS